MEKQVTLDEREWRILSECVDGWLREVAQYDDEDEQYLALKAVRNKIDAQLGRSSASIGG